MNRARPMAARFNDCFYCNWSAQLLTNYVNAITLTVTFR